MGMSKKVFASVLVFLGGALVSGEDAMRFIPADDARLSYSDYVRMSFVDSPEGTGLKLARFDRIADMPGKGYRWDNPGTRLRFRTDAPKIQVQLDYSDKHVSTSARNPVGRYLVDGKSESSWTFASAQRETVRKTERLAVELSSPSPGQHDYEIVLPYADSVDALGISVNESARFEQPTPRPAKRLVAYGDSITHGFTSSEVTKSYIYLFAQKMNHQVVNLGLGGRGLAATDGDLIGSQKGDLVSVLIGVNDWQGGKKIEAFQANAEGFFKNLRAKQPEVPVVVITPLWVPESWKPTSATMPLEEYRKILRDVVAGLHDKNIRLVEGPDLIDHEDKYFDKVAVHPNDAGFAIMADRLAAAAK